MQYYVKIFNKDTSEFVGYYKETGVGCITKLPKGMKFFNYLEEAYEKALDLDEGFLREKDGHYYTSHAIVVGDSTREVTKDPYRNSNDKESDRDDEIKTFIRQSGRRNCR